MKRSYMNAEDMSKNCSSVQKHVLPPIYGIEMCVSLMGNILALWLLVTRERKNWHTGVVFACNLAISDILYALTLPLLIIDYSGDRKWTFGAATCKLERFLFTCNLYASIFFIMCISVNRYLAIVHPFFTRNHVRPKHAKMVCVLVWITVAIISSPVLSFAGIKVKSERCSLFKNNTNSTNGKFIYRTSLCIIGCLIPFMVTFMSYAGLIRVVLKNMNIKPVEKRKVSLMVGLVCFLYMISFVPYHILQIIHFSSRPSESENKSCLVRNAYQFSKGLAALNMCLHPILYTAMFDSIRTVCCRRRKKALNATEEMVI